LAGSSNLRSHDARCLAEWPAQGALRPAEAGSVDVAEPVLWAELSEWACDEQRHARRRAGGTDVADPVAASRGHLWSRRGHRRWVSRTAPWCPLSLRCARWMGLRVCMGQWGEPPPDEGAKPTRRPSPRAGGEARPR